MNISIPPDWDQIETVCLDMDGTVLDLHFDNHFWLEYLPQIYAKDNHLTIQQSRQILFKKFDQAKGQLNWYCLDYWTEQLSIDIAHHKKAVANRIAIRPNAIEFLDYVKALNKTLYLVTNAHHDSLRLKITQTGIGKHFNALISAHDYGLAKEEVGFWCELQKHYPINLEKTLFIDDSRSVLLAAKKAGIGFVLGISQPDSQQPAKPVSGFTQLDNFSDMMS